MWELRVNSCRWEQRSPRTSWARSSFGTIRDESSLRRLHVTSSWSRGKRQGSKWSHFAPPHWLDLGSPFLLDSGPRLSWPLANPGNAQAKKNVRIITSFSHCLKTIDAWSWRSYMKMTKRTFDMNCSERWLGTRSSTTALLPSITIQLKFSHLRRYEENQYQKFCFFVVDDSKFSKNLCRNLADILQWKPSQMYS